MIYISEHDFALCLLIIILSATVNIWLFPLFVFFHKILMGSDLAKKTFNNYY